MPTLSPVPVDALFLDLLNFRTIKQRNELHAINTMIAISPGWFWALLESILDDGYHPTENIIVLEIQNKKIVKEGNRRIAALKIIFGMVKGIEIPSTISEKIALLTKDWLVTNRNVPCTIYSSAEIQTVEKIISLVHGKGEKAGRDHWTPVARARYNRDIKKQSEPGLDLLEKYLKFGKNLSTSQSERWSGDYPLSVLDEAIRVLIPHLSLKNKNDLIKSYPKINKSKIDRILLDIGIAKLDFKIIRNKENFFGGKYGIANILPFSPTAGSQTSTSNGSPNNVNEPKTSSKTKTYALSDPKSVQKKLKTFSPKGSNREKIVTLLNEIRTLNLNQHQHAFCFLLRSMFEISAKAYCKDHKSSSGLIAVKKDGFDKKLSDLLQEITKHLTQNNSDTEMVKELHGAMTEIAKPTGILSVTSMNQLVHNPSFSIQAGDISRLFHNVFPLLENMNN